MHHVWGIEIVYDNWMHVSQSWVLGPDLTLNE